MISTLLLCLLLVLCAGLLVTVLVVFRELRQRVDPFAASVLRLLLMYEERGRARTHEAATPRKETI